MGEFTVHIPKLELQPPAVDFIDNRLPHHHAMFAGHPNHYDPLSKKYVSNLPPLTSPTCNEAPQEDSGDGDSELEEYKLPPRPALSDTKAMKYWAAMFPAAMATMTLKPIPPATEPSLHTISAVNLTGKPCTRNWNPQETNIARKAVQYDGCGRCGEEQRIISRQSRRLLG